MTFSIMETCNNEKKTSIITDNEVDGAARSTIGKTLTIIEHLNTAGLKPEVLRRRRVSLCI